MKSMESAPKKVHLEGTAEDGSDGRLYVNSKQLNPAPVFIKFYSTMTKYARPPTDWSLIIKNRS